MRKEERVHRSAASNNDPDREVIDKPDKHIVSPSSILHSTSIM
jgi:phosphoglucomutase